MLKNTFCHIPGIGEKTERSLWSAGITSWESAIARVSFPLPRSIRDSWDRYIAESDQHYRNRNGAYFTDNLPSNQHWRLYRDFQDECAFVDIETTGLHPGAAITTAVLYDGRSIRYYVKGTNLDEFPKHLNDYPLLVTYNGRCFDVPMIERFFGIRLRLAHIDLRYALWSLGLKGGLKGCERQLGMARPGMEDVDGFVAVLLWHDYRDRNDTKALETLLAYNIQDTVALHSLMVHVHNAKIVATPFASSHCLSPPVLPESPFMPDRDTVARFVCPASPSPFIFGNVSAYGRM